MAARLRQPLSRLDIIARKILANGEDALFSFPHLAQRDAISALIRGPRNSGTPAGDFPRGKSFAG